MLSLTVLVRVFYGLIIGSAATPHNPSTATKLTVNTSPRNRTLRVPICTRLCSARPATNSHAGYTGKYLWKIGGPLSLIYTAVIVLMVNLLY